MKRFIGRLATGILRCAGLLLISVRARLEPRSLGASLVPRFIRVGLYPALAGVWGRDSCFWTLTDLNSLCFWGVPRTWTSKTGLEPDAVRTVLPLECAWLWDQSYSGMGLELGASGIGLQPWAQWKVWHWNMLHSWGHVDQHSSRRDLKPVSTVVGPRTLLSS